MNPAETPRKLIMRVLLSKARMEALTDGIFAIAMTLLVLELKVPDLPKTASSGELLHSLGQQMPSFFSFFVSFLYCGLLWFMHHMAMHFIRHLQAVLVWLNLLFLMSISILPFSCGLLGHFLRNRAADEIYFGNMFAAAVLLAAQWWFAKRKQLVNQDDPRATRAVGQQIWFFLPALAAAMAGTLYHLEAGFYAMALVLVALRVWQRADFRRQPAPGPSPPISS